MCQQEENHGISLDIVKLSSRIHEIPSCRIICIRHPVVCLAYSINDTFPHPLPLYTDYALLKHGTINEFQTSRRSKTQYRSCASPDHRMMSIPQRRIVPSQCSLLLGQCCSTCQSLPPYSQLTDNQSAFFPRCKASLAISPKCWISAPRCCLSFSTVVSMAASSFASCPFIAV